MNGKNSRCCVRRAPLSNGFTLMELLIVIAIILILMLMAIPTIGGIKKQANETSAINSVQVIEKAQMQYESTYPVNGYACSLTALGGDPKSGAPTPAAAQLMQSDLASGIKSGYIFAISNCTKVNLNRGFCSDEFGTIKSDPAGGTNCTQPLQ